MGGREAEEGGGGRAVTDGGERTINSETRLHLVRLRWRRGEHGWPKWRRP